MLKDAKANLTSPLPTGEVSVRNAKVEIYKTKKKKKGTLNKSLFLQTRRVKEPGTPLKQRVQMFNASFFFSSPSIRSKVPPRPRLSFGTFASAVQT